MLDMLGIDTKQLKQMGEQAALAAEKVSGIEQELKKHTTLLQQIRDALRK